MNKFFSYISINLFIFFSFSQSVTIKGIAPSYIGSTIKIYSISDYLSKYENIITSSQIKSDSTFSITFDIKETQKIIIECKNNRGFLFIQKGGLYNIFLPRKDKYDPYRKTGNNIEISFIELDSSDINYKILGFQRWIDRFIGNNFYIKNIKPKKFAENLEKFKLNVEKAYKNDNSNYFKTHVKFSIASLDNIQTLSERNRYEKHDFYIKHSPIEYKNEAYMSYISDFYQNMTPIFSEGVYNKLYKGIMKSSPKLIMIALGGDYTLINLRIRELVMINILSEEYNKNNFPKKNIENILDSLSNKSLFKAHENIAKNIKYRITKLLPGSKAKEIIFKEEGKSSEVKIVNSQGKHIYIHFFNPESEENKKELLILNELFLKYNNYIKFISIYKKDYSMSKDSKMIIEKIPWNIYGISESNSIWEDYQIKNFPQYTLIDGTGHIVASPALTPKPNGNYETIEKTFFYIQRFSKSTERKK